MLIELLPAKQPKQMIYTIEKADMITAQFKKFTTAYTHMVAGHFANIDFWMKEATEALNAIDYHRKRFNKMYDAQKNWVEDHGTVVHSYCSICKGKCEFSNGRPTLPEFRYKTELTDARKNLVNAVYYFLIRCARIGLLSEEELKSACESIGTSVDPTDLNK